MHHRSSLSLCKFMFSRYPLHRSSIPITHSINPRFFHNKLPITNPQNTLPNSSTQFAILNEVRYYSVEIDKEVDEINLKFAEAREEIETAMDSKETVYFNEEAECARDAVKEVVELYEELLQKVSENEKGVIQRSMGLKIHQLKAELDQLNE
ncbi:hypothetical protein Leryth_019589 [Lithospermum erythrorhizon]|nr:hypothetical protein Leryth_019589 [Lithospermum erythrorhizon]